ncbi:MAG: hypothetical protein Q8S54_14210 [Bacteroidota bacterium]|nr:hypothetical protein [Odoribacter sp.]MDP3644328.1 hypothetical protein [Bacteroidota bacterium]
MESNNQNVRFSLAKISTDQFAIIPASFKIGEIVNLKTSLQFGSNKESKLISVKASFQFEQQLIPFLIIEASCFFNIEPNDWNTFVQEAEIVVPKSIITHLTVLTVGTVRGILHAKTEGTNFNGFVIPTINVTELVTGDIRM